MNTTLNNAILKVILNQFKKDCPEAHAIVEQAGYTIIKFNGNYHVKNKDTNRDVYMTHGSYSSSIEYWSTTARSSVRYYYNEPVKFDFVGYLNKPFNQTWYGILNSWSKHDEWYYKKDRLKLAKLRLKNRTEYIQKTKAEIKRLQDKLIEQVEDMVSAKYELEQVRKDLGLIKED